MSQNALSENKSQTPKLDEWEERERENEKEGQG